MFLQGIVFSFSLIVSGLLVAISADSQFDVVAKKKFFIDRSLLVERLFPYRNNRLILARRESGKTTNLKMIRQFLEVHVDKKGKTKPPNTAKHHALFKGLKIGKRPFFENHFARYPVIYLDLAEFVVTGTAADFKKSFQKVVRRLITEHEYLFQSKNLKDCSRKQLKDDVDRILAEQKATMSFYDCYFGKWLSEKMREHFNQTVVVLIDGVDAPAMAIIESNKTRVQENFIRDVADIISRLVDRNDDNVFTVLSTGVTTHGLGIFDDPKFAVYHALDSELRDYYGVTEDELRHLLTLAGVPQTKEQLETLRQMYGGYKLTHPLMRDERDVYSTQSIIKFCEQKVVKPYWDVASTIQPIKKLLLYHHFGSTIESAFYEEVFISWAAQEIGIRDLIEINEFLTGNRTNIEGTPWSTGGYMYESGFFTIRSTQDIYRIKFAVTIPNNEVRHALLDQVLDKEYYQHKHNITETSIQNFVQSVAKLNESEASFEHLTICILHLFGNKEQITILPSFKFLLYAYLRKANEDLFKKVHVEIGPEDARKIDMVTTRKDGVKIVWGLTLGEESGAHALKKTVDDKHSKDFSKRNTIYLGVNVLNTGERCDLGYLYETNKIKDAKSLTIYKNSNQN